MSLNVNEMRSMSVSAYRKRKRVRGLNKGRRVKRTTSGSKFRTTMRTYKALLRHNRRPKKTSTIRKMIRTRKIRARRLGGAGYGARESVYRHSDTFIGAVTEFAEATGRSDIAADLLEGLDPRMTSTKIGIAGMGIAEKVDGAAQIGPAFFDMTILDEKTLAFYFEKGDNITTQAIEKALAEHGKPTLLVKPGDDLTEKEVSDVFMYALAVDEKNLSGIKVEMDEEIECDKESGEPKLDEKDYMSDADYEKFAGEVVQVAEAA